jgi:tRNA pseudouridine synthase 10
MEYEIKPFEINLSNFYGFRFRKRRIKARKPGKCKVCGNLFEKLEEYADEAIQKLKKINFKRFVVGIRLNDELVMKEESLWEKFGISHCEPLRSEINRELGKLIEKKTRKIPDERKPEITILLDLQKERVDIQINPIYIYGRYNKLIRGIPQTKWKKYKETVEDIIAKPFMRETKGSSHSMHACGREDIDARCLGWRPFILEIEHPKVREINLEKMRKEVNKTRKVKIKDLRYSDKKEVVKLKSLKPDKVYRVMVKFERPVENIELSKGIIGTIEQRTPKRVLHRRANKLRKKGVKNIKWKRINKRKYVFEIRTEAGVYIKELVSGDSGRTRPSISSLLNNKAEADKLDVIKIIIQDSNGKGK